MWHNLDLFQFSKAFSLEPIKCDMYDKEYPSYNINELLLYCYSYNGKDLIIRYDSIFTKEQIEYLLNNRNMIYQLLEKRFPNSVELI